MIHIETMRDIRPEFLDKPRDVFIGLSIPDDAPPDTDFLPQRLPLIFEIHGIDKIPFPRSLFIFRMMHGKESDLMSSFLKQTRGLEIDLFRSTETEMEFVDQKYPHMCHCIKTFGNDILAS